MKRTVCEPCSHTKPLEFLNILFQHCLDFCPQRTEKLAKPFFQPYFLSGRIINRPIKISLITAMPEQHTPSRNKGKQPSHVSSIASQWPPLELTPPDLPSSSQEQNTTVPPSSVAPPICKWWPFWNFFFISLYTLDWVISCISTGFLKIIYSL